VARAPTTDNLGFLLAKASQRWNELLTQAFAAHGYAQVRASYGSVLLPLWQQDGLRMGALAERARLSKQTMTTLVRLAERDGLVRRAPDPLDGRAILVWLTPSAIDLGPIAADVVDGLQARATAALGDRAVHDTERALIALMQL
jgi:MarR family transcriptional regulator for hemolysin